MCVCVCVCGGGGGGGGSSLTEGEGKALIEKESGNFKEGIIYLVVNTVNTYSFIWSILL